MLRFSLKQSLNSVAILLLLLHLTTQTFANIVAPPCSFSPTNITVQGPGIIGFTSSVLPVVYVPNGTLNGAPKWENANFGAFPYRLVWTGTVWQFQQMSNGIPVVVVAQNNTGSSTLLPCEPNGWQDPDDNGYFNPGQLTIGGGCGSLTAPTITPSVAIAANPGSAITSGTGVTFTATPTNGGSTPSYQWKKNNTNVGMNSPTYTDNALTDGDEIMVEMTSSDPCASPATATSAGITMTVNPAALSPSCYKIQVSTSCSAFNGEYLYAGDYLGGGYWAKSDNPNFEIWFDGNSWVIWDYGSYLFFNSTASLPLPPTIGWLPWPGNACDGMPITNFQLIPVLQTPTVTIVANPGNNITAGTSVTFTATPTNGGSTPSYQWKKNNTNVGMNSPTYTDNALTDGDEIMVEMTSSDPCANPATATSNAITMEVTTCNPTTFPETFYEHVSGITSYNNINGAGIAYGAGKFVAVVSHYDTGGYIYTSTDGVNWTEQTPPTPNNYGFSNVLYANGQFMTVGWNNYVHISNDGINWSAHDVGHYNRYLGIAYGNGTWLIVGSDGVLRKSTDNGVTWTGIASPANVNWISATYGNGVFVIGGLGNAMFASSDLVSWTPWDQYVFAFQALNVSFGDGKFVAVRSNGNIFTSPNGINWTAQNSPATSNLFSVTYLNGQFLASNWFGVGELLNSVAGQCWSSQPTGFFYGFLNMAYGNGIYAAVNGTGNIYSTLCHTPVDFAFTSLNGCAEGAGATLELAGSEINYNYQLEKDGSAIGSPVAGSGEALQFTGLTNPGIYTVAATSLTGNCTAVMTVSNPVVSGELPDISQLTVETCFGQTVNLSATTSVGSINWYDAEIGGNLLGNSASGEDFPVSPATTTTYYAQINAVPSGTQIFQFTGASQTFVVPAGVTSITVTAKGAGGSDGYYEDGPPGEGGIVTTDLAVTPGQALNIYVGGLPTGDYEEIGGYNGGGSSLAQYYGAGGGATDIRINGTALANRVIVAGGGGGAGYDGTGGGNGGGLVGEAGDDDTNYPDEAKGGGGGTQSASGAGGFGNGGSGYPGTLGQGGDGADYDYYGAGGGGGYYGGGGGGENASGGYVGGGGGGSSYTDLTLCTNTQHTQGGNPGNGIVILNWGSGGCPSPIRVPVVVNTGPAITTTNITACGSYTWAITGQTYTQPGTYTVTVSDCDIQTLNLTIPPGQVISLNGATTVCVGGTIGLVATGGNQYQWSGPNGFSAVGGSITRSSATTAMSGVYTVTITNNSCQNVLSTTVTVYPIPSATISGATAVCSGGTISLSAPAGAASYAWSGPGGFTASTQTITRPNATTAFAGNYTVTVTGAGGCTATASRSVSVSSPTAATITGATSFCSNNAITLTATTAGVSYQWSGPGGFSFSGATMTRTPAVAGTYIVTVTTAAGCTSSGSRSVTVTASPNATITNNSTCSRIWLLASGGNSYAWSGPNGFNTTGTTVLRNNPTTNMWGTYSVTITSNGCTATASVTVSPCGAGKNAGEEIVQNMAVYPNPTGSISNISFYSQIEEPVTLKVFAADGKEIALLFNQTTQPDTAYNLVFDATQLSNGTYYAILRHANGTQETLPVLVVK